MSKKIYLYSGAILIIIFFAIALSGVYEPTIKLPLEDFITIMPVWVFCIFGILIAPPVEELAFRNWQIAKPKWKWLSLILFLFYCATASSIWFIVPGIVALVIFFKVKGRYRTDALILLTSVIFAAIHLPTAYTSFDYYFLLLVYTGIAFILSYLRHKYGLRYAIVFHAIWNLVMFTLSIGSLTLHEQKYEFNLGDTKIKLRKHSVFETNVMRSSKTSDTISINYKTAGQIAIMLADKSKEYVYKDHSNDFVHFSLKVTSPQKIDRLQVLRIIAPVLKIKMDTTTKKATVYDLKLTRNPDTLKLKKDMFGYYGYFKGFAVSLSDRYGTKFYSDDTTYVELSYNNLLPLKQQLQDLKKRYGIESTERMGIVKEVVITN